MRVHCPVCDAACPVPEEIADARALRCGHCGLVFAAKDAIRATPGDLAPPSPAPGFVPPPPAVIYGPVSAADTRPVMEDVSHSPMDPMPPPETPAAATGAGDVVPRSLSGGLGIGPLGPPPPYKPPVETQKSPPSPVEMAPAPPPVALNIRTLSALGPPPPYRPIIQAGASFGRGPAPDLEPWRLASLSRRPAAVVARVVDEDPIASAPADSEWTLPREADPPVYADYAADQVERRDRLAVGLALTPAWPVDDIEGPAQEALLRRRAIRAIKGRTAIGGRPGARPVLWAAGLAMSLAVAASLYVERRTVLDAVAGIAKPAAVTRQSGPLPAAVPPSDKP